MTASLEVLFVTTGATDLPAALERVPRAVLAASTIVALLNGIDHVPLLRARYRGGVNVYTELDDTRVPRQKLAGSRRTLLTTSSNAPLGTARERYPNWLTALANEAAEAGGRDGVRTDAGVVAS